MELVIAPHLKETIMTQDIVRVLRIIEYVGPRDWVEKTLLRSVQGRKDCSTGTVPTYIQAVTLSAYPEILSSPPDNSSS